MPIVLGDRNQILPSDRNPKARRHINWERMLALALNFAAWILALAITAHWLMQ